MSKENFLSEAEFLAALAEEASELSHAALKLRRVLDGSNPTKKREEEARAHFEEEIRDLMMCIVALGYEPQIG